MTPGGMDDTGNNNVVPLLPRSTVQLEFKNITCSMNTFSINKLRFERRDILKGVDGSFKPGELTAIMGPSGAGKTTLLNILAGYLTRGAKGEIAVNGVCACASKSAGRGGARYIRQQDDLRAHLTVYEAMCLAAALKLADFTSHERKEKVYEVLALLGLSGASQTLCRDLSGGQKRRLAVALELLSDPSLLFLDEPTTGLDSSASTSLIALLNSLARGGRTLVATIHQPSALLFEKIDSIYCLSEGRTLYKGPRRHLLPALASAGLRCPPYHNPADFLMEVASQEYKIDLIQAAKTMRKFKPELSDDTWEAHIPTIPALPGPLDITTELKSKQLSGNIKYQQKHSKTIYRQSGLLRQTWILLYRNYLMTTRNYSLFMYRVAAHVVIALIFGYLYLGVGSEASTVLGNYVYLYGSMLLVVYTGKMSVTLSFPLEMDILKGEYFNRWYSLGPYIVSILAVELPFQMISCVSYVVLSYWLTDNPLEPNRATLFLATIVATSLCAQAWGYFIGSTTPTKIAVFLGPVVACLFSVFGFCLALSDTPYPFRWLHHISYFRAGFHVAVHSVYGFNRTKIHCSKRRKTILDDMSGSFNAGELTVIMGQSGAGKSSLMDILAGYTKPSTGSLCVNGRVRNEKSFRRRSCYILQDDKVQDALTIHESLSIAAQLKLGNHVSCDQKRQRVEEIITSLGLSRARNTRAGNLSGGQKKRLAIGLELVSDPTVMFLDEPTSGLDSSISKQLVFLLHLLARQGRTVVVTMHQPSAALLQMVDKLYVVVTGKCAYNGSVPGLLPYLAQMNLMCPPYHNPVDFLIEICNENANLLVTHSGNGKCDDWSNHISHETDDNFIEKNNLRTDEVYLTTLPAPKEDPTNKILLKLKSTYSTSVWKQFATLTRRSLLSLWRNPAFTIMITGIHCSMALFIGCLFHNIGGDAKYVRDSYNMLYFSLMFLMFTAFSSVTINFPEQIPVVRREHFNRWYTTGAYYTSTLASTLPTQTVCTLCYACIVYYMTGLPPEFMRFVVFCWTLLMVSYVSLCVGLLNGSIFNVKNGVVFGSFFIMPFTIFSGFFLRYSDAPFIFRWMFHVSFLKHGLVGLVLAIFGMERPKMPCTELYCHYTYPKKFIQDVEMTHEDYSLVVAALFCIGMVVMFSSYLILKVRLKNKW